MNRFLKRNKVYERAASTILPRKLYIYCEGDVREKDYFDFFKGLSSNIEVITIRDEEGRTDPESLMHLAERDFSRIDSQRPSREIEEDNLDEIWFVIDTDHWNESGKIGKVLSFCHMRNSGKKYSVWNVAQSNPSFEIWLYYHQHDEKPKEEDVARFHSFKEFVHKSYKSGFDSVRMPSYMEDAIKNASENYQIESGQPALYSTQVHFLGSKILPYVKGVLDRLKPMIK